LCHFTPAQLEWSGRKFLASLRISLRGMRLPV
jgi:hypothetical protein